MKRFSLIYLVLGSLMAIAEIVLTARWELFANVDFQTTWLLLIPPAACCVAFVLARRYPRAAVHGIAIPLCLLICAAWLGMIVLAHELQTALLPVTDVGEYRTLIDSPRISTHHFTDYFPRTIPAEAQDVRFHYQVRIGQGAKIIQLRYRSTPGKIAALYDRFATQKTKSYFGGESDSYLNDPAGMPISNFWTSGSDDIKFPHDFEIMIFNKVPSEQLRSRPLFWNHGASHGVAISKQRNEIVYWAQRW